MAKYKVNRHIYGLITSVQSKPGDIIEMRPEDANEYVQHGAISPVTIRTKEEKKTKK